MLLIRILYNIMDHCIFLEKKKINCIFNHLTLEAG